MSETEKQKIIRDLLTAIGEDPDREGLRETPARIVKAWETWFSGYSIDPKSVLKTFSDGAEKCDDDEMVLQTGIPVNSMCEHHMGAIFGVAHIAYIPDGKVVGLSKMKRLVDVFAHRLQVQERLTGQIADAITEHLSDVGVGVVLKCRHMCMESRGIHVHGIQTTTSALRGALKKDPAARAEFMSLIQMNQ